MWELSFSPLLQVLVASMLPIGELRLGIPLGIIGLNLHWFPVFITSLIGNLIPVLPILIMLNWVPKIIPHLPSWMNKLWVFQNRRIILIHEKYSNYVSVNNAAMKNSIILILLVAIPLPFTGVWTGCFVAWMLRLDVRQAFPPIALGAAIAGVVVTSVVLGPFEWLSNIVLIEA
tara:strand:- start:110 stop:631 length:522 start_codon:yes stop_codon:yes gene_type:complete